MRSLALRIPIKVLDFISELWDDLPWYGRVAFFGIVPVFVITVTVVVAVIA